LLSQKDDKRHGYWALVESYRSSRGPRQRVVAYLGEMDAVGRRGIHQQAAGAVAVAQHGLWKTLAQLCQRAGLGHEPGKVFEELGDITLVDVVLPTRSGVTIRKRCIGRATEHQAILLHHLNLHLPNSLEMAPM
jgi:hypothetical protein